jgi:hypothetical protein
MNKIITIKTHLPERDKSYRRFGIHRFCTCALRDFTAHIHTDIVPAFVLCTAIQKRYWSRQDDGVSAGIRTKCIANASQVCYLSANSLSVISINVIVAQIQTHNKECSELLFGVLYVIAWKETGLLHGNSIVNNFFLHRRRMCSVSEKKSTFREVFISHRIMCSQFTSYFWIVLELLYLINWGSMAHHGSHI